MTRRRARVLLVALLVVASPGARPTPSRAEPTTEQRSIAAALFSEARRLMQEERFAEACPRLEESQRLDPSGGTLLNLATCLRLVGRTASARARFAEALAVARRDGRTDRVQACKAALDELEHEIATLELHVEPGRCAAQVIRLNGVEVPALAWGSPLPVDPGPVEVASSAPGCSGSSATVRVSPREHARHHVARLLAGAAPRASPTAEKPALEAPGEERATPIGGALRLDVDGKLRGAALALGPAVEVAPFLELTGLVLLGGTLGVEADARAAPLGTRGAFRPVVFGGGTLFFDDGAYPGARVGAGVEWRVAAPLWIGVTSGAAIFPDVPPGFDRVVFVPAVDLHVRP